MKKSDIHEVYEILEDVYRNMDEPSVTKISKQTRRDPFRVLISCLISLRTKDEVTLAASNRLFAKADTPEKMLTIPADEIAKLIYPAGFYKTKSNTITNICRILLDEYDGKVPDEIDELLKLKGVGRKTANLVVVEGYGRDAICVDTHVHRIFNRLGYVATKTPDKTEMELRKHLPIKYWIRINEILVSYGREICTPVSPHCSYCRLSDICDKVSVDRRR
ncbi:DNA-(apurinic or apyrimidinic site) lyase [Denitrovibrio acetiphilus DSM 12809]|uniref:Endonuclease III n=1 Tax=Denitrovibrio acetiphilus (strain DSM 12809 / NBRC 114555 / N2460) TaxID=522772 RepID=D4H3R3_DENA2|nr:endonuclease III [Denitrovibrio acetiphilus]ADD69165.1 DNA-(apurinic or apyrimidinic site) lyase [Denitrovibrio acetiphilus DSM 12809]